MRLDGRRNSSNIEDRRHISGKAIGIGGGITGVIVAAIITLLSGGSLTDVARNTIGVLAAICVAFVLYVGLLLALHALERDDVLMMPKGQTLVRLLRL